MGHDDLPRRPVQPLDTSSQDRNGSTQLVTRPTPQMNAQGYGDRSTILLSGTGQQISHRNFQQTVSGGANQNRVIRNALSSDKRRTGYSENHLPIPNGVCDPTIPEEEMRFVLAVSDSSSYNTTLPVSVGPCNTAMPVMAPMTVLESPMMTTPSFQSVPTMSNGSVQLQQQQNAFQSEQNSLQLQQQNSSQLSEPASLEDLMNNDDEPTCMMDFVDNSALALPVSSSMPQFNQCPTGTSSNNNNNGGSHAESGNGGHSHCVTGYSHQNYGPSMVTGGTGGGGLGGSGGGDDPYKNNRTLQRDPYAEGNVFIDSETEDLLRIIEGSQFDELTGQSMALMPNLQTSEIFSELDNLSGNNATTPGDNMMAYYSKFDSSGGGLQPMEESVTSTDPSPAISTPAGISPAMPTPAGISPALSTPAGISLAISTPAGMSPAMSTPTQVQGMPIPASTHVPTATTTPVPVTATTPGSDSIGSVFDMIKMMNKPRKQLPRPPAIRPSNLVLEPPSPAGSFMSAPSPVPPTPSTPHLSHPVQVSTPRLPPTPQRAPSVSADMPPPSPASPPTPANVRPFDCQRYEEDGKIFLELLVRNDLPEAERRFTLQAFFSSAQFCMDLTDVMRNPCDLKISNHVCANICDFKFDSEQSKLVFSIPANCKHVNQWLSEKGLEASFLDRHAVLQQVLNTMAAIHNSGRDKSLWGSFMVFVAPDLRVYMIPDIIPMLCKMQSAMGDGNFHPRYEDSRAVYDLYTQLIPSTINQNKSWISPGVNQLLQSFRELVKNPSSVFKMAEIARTLGEKRMCRMEVDYLGLAKVDLFCVEHELVLTALTSIQTMVPEGAAIVWLPSGQPVAIQDLATAVRQMRLRVSYA